MQQPPLFDPALAAFAITAYYAYPSGWKVRVTRRFEGSVDWEQSGVYEGLSTGEAVDVAAAELMTLQEAFGSSQGPL